MVTYLVGLLDAATLRRNSRATPVAIDFSPAREVRAAPNTASYNFYGSSTTAGNTAFASNYHHVGERARGSRTARQAFSAVQYICH
jgi:hypothetical protein